MSRFGILVKQLRRERSLTLEEVARKIGSHKGYVSGIENDKVNPPSVKIIQKYAKCFGQDARALERLAWVDKAPAIIKKDAEPPGSRRSTRPGNRGRERATDDMLILEEGRKVSWGSPYWPGQFGGHAYGRAQLQERSSPHFARRTQPKSLLAYRGRSRRAKRGSGEIPRRE